MQVNYLSWKNLKDIHIKVGAVYSIEVHPELLKSADELLQIYLSNQTEALKQFDALKANIISIASASTELPIADDAELNDLIVEIEWIVEEPVHDPADYIEAQLKGYIYLVSARLAFLVAANNKLVQWLDPRDIAVTDEAWIQSNVDIDLSRTRLGKLSPEQSYITTHGVGASSDNQNTLTANHKTWDLLV